LCGVYALIQGVTSKGPRNARRISSGVVCLIAKFALTRQSN
jgi:hypothetical protein